MKLPQLFCNSSVFREAQLTYFGFLNISLKTTGLKIKHIVWFSKRSVLLGLQQSSSYSDLTNLRMLPVAALNPCQAQAWWVRASETGREKQEQDGLVLTIPTAIKNAVWILSSFFLFSHSDYKPESTILADKGTLHIVQLCLMQTGPVTRCCRWDWYVGSVPDACAPLLSIAGMVLSDTAGGSQGWHSWSAMTHLL